MAIRAAFSAFAQGDPQPFFDLYRDVELPAAYARDAYRPGHPVMDVMRPMES